MRILRTEKEHPDADMNLRTNDKSITADTPLTPIEQKFVIEYIKTGKPGEALKNAGCVLHKYSYTAIGKAMLKQPNVKAEVDRMVEEIHNAGIAEASEVMEYFTSVMRGQIKDQFGLDASLSERTKAAQELAKRTIDLENREARKADQTIEIKSNSER